MIAHECVAYDDLLLAVTRRRQLLFPTVGVVAREGGSPLYLLSGHLAHRHRDNVVNVYLLVPEHRHLVRLVVVLVLALSLRLAAALWRFRPRRVAVALQVFRRRSAGSGCLLVPMSSTVANHATIRATLYAVTMRLLLLLLLWVVLVYQQTSTRWYPSVDLAVLLGWVRAVVLLANAESGPHAVVVADLAGRLAVELVEVHHHRGLEVLHRRGHRGHRHRSIVQQIVLITMMVVVEGQVQVELLPDIVRDDCGHVGRVAVEVGERVALPHWYRHPAAHNTHRRDTKINFKIENSRRSV